MSCLSFTCARSHVTQSLSAWVLVLGVALMGLTACDEQPTNPGTPPTTAYIRDVQYLRYRYFWLFDPYSTTDSNWVTRVSRADSLVVTRLYKSAAPEYGYTSPLALVIPAVPPNLDPYSVRQHPDSVYDPYQRLANVELLEPTEYFVEPHQFWLTVSDSKPIKEVELLACYLEIQTPTGIDTVGSMVAPADTSSVNVSLVLRMLKSISSSSAHPTWDLEWKNVYDLGAKPPNQGGVVLDILRGPAGSEATGLNPFQWSGIPFLEILGLDQYSADGSQIPDGFFDQQVPVLDRYRGHVFFPNRYPFAPSSYPAAVPTAAEALLPRPPSYSPSGVGLPVEAPGIYGGMSSEQRQQASTYYLAVRFYP